MALVLARLIAWTFLILQVSTSLTSLASLDRSVSSKLFLDLEELSRLVAISYCVGNTGIHEPFECLSHCSDFKSFQLVATWSTGLVESSSSGYIALSHPPNDPRILITFRGTHSFSDAVNDLMTTPAEYLPYPVNNASCTDCSVHSGFMSSWNDTKQIIMPIVERLVVDHPRYEIALAGHSLGGAVAGLAALEMKARGWTVKVTTFGEPRMGNKEMARYMDLVFPWNVSEANITYRRVTHVHDPVPLLPFEDWGWSTHGGEIFISKSGLPPSVEDLERCESDKDERCIEGAASSTTTIGTVENPNALQAQDGYKPSGWPGVPASWEMWQLLFAHREYFWRLGLCFDPQWRDYPRNESKAMD